MPMFWEPDICTDAPPCKYEIQEDWAKIISVQRTCKHHQNLLDGGLTEQELFEAVLQSCRLKEASKSGVKVAMGLADDAVVAYTVDAAGDITVESKATPAEKIVVDAEVAAKTAPIAKPVGTSTVTVV